MQTQKWARDPYNSDEKDAQMCGICMRNGDKRIQMTRGHALSQKFTKIQGAHVHRGTITMIHPQPTNQPNNHIHPSKTNPPLFHIKVINRGTIGCHSQIEQSIKHTHVIIIWQYTGGKNKPHRHTERHRHRHVYSVSEETSHTGRRDRQEGRVQIRTLSAMISSLYCSATNPESDCFVSAGPPL